VSVESTGSWLRGFVYFVRNAAQRWQEAASQANESCPNSGPAGLTGSGLSL